MEQPRINEYAKLLVEVGLNVQPGQTVVIRAPLQSVDFVRLCAEAAYNAGAREVVHDWNDDALTRMKFLRAAEAVFDECPAWFSDKLNTLAREKAAFLSIYADDPETLRGVDPDRIRRSAQSRGKALKEYREATMNNKARWCVASVPIPVWARKVFPNQPDAVEALWDAIYDTLRLTGDGKAVERWREHIQRTQARCDALNAMELTSLHYRNSLGTDLTVGLPDGAIWLGGADVDADGIPFVANMPTEEIFTAPHRDRVNGTLVSSMPFSLHGNVIDRFTMTFNDGKITGIDTRRENDRILLEKAIAVDEGAAYLGEAALVPYDSPIRNLGVLFYNTLFDENAACHFAFGEAYPCVKGAASMSKDELTALGINESITHEDFMIGTADLTVTGTARDGRKIPVFVNGNFAF